MLARFQTDDKNFQLLQTSWSAELNPLLSNPLSNGIFLSNVLLINGSNTINHLLGRKMQGWFITDQNASASIYRSQPLNAQTLTLTSNANVTVTIYGF